MYYPYFIAYMLAGFGISLVALFWALRNGQFNDQERARFLPLEEDTGEVVKVSRFNRYEGYVLMVLATAGIAATVAVLMFSIVNGSRAL